ncbi:hypothetical protein SAMN05216554_2671 [Herbiconiux ginsengi]|uniref:NYN domain-containing protein n=2 Tax=Herbiconiux ginsengi TaxID=381665 RepID=A0A1H3QPZ6_9MICO|nr:hypothetical protein SAMN05216554_2671 [Herbiconiux ginsengi]
MGDGAPSRAIADVDGFNLYNGIHDAYDRRYLWLDLVKLFEALRPRNELIRVKYFTAILIDDPETQKRQAEYIAALKAAHPGRVDVVVRATTHMVRTIFRRSGFRTSFAMNADGCVDPRLLR